MVIMMTFSDGESEENDDDNVFDKEISFFQAYHIFKNQTDRHKSED